MDQRVAVSDWQFQEDIDSLYVLPLRVVPIKSRALKRARMIKDAHLESAIEVFSNKETGSGQVYLADLDEDMLHPDPDVAEEDLRVLSCVASLHSFDVYSLRIGLREADIEIESEEYLSLSPAKKAELKEYMMKFSLPLIKQVYGGDDVEVKDASDIIRLFSDPDVDAAIQKLRRLSEKLNIKLGDIPRFLEDFSDIYLSFAYFQQYLDDITPKMIEFIGEISMLKENWQMRQDHRLMDLCRSLENDMNNLISGVTGRFESFNKQTDQMWENITAERFERVKELIASHHSIIGGVLCGLGSKMNCWRESFPDRNMGGPVRRAELMRSDISPGMGKIVKLERSTPIASQM